MNSVTDRLLAVATVVGAGVLMGLQYTSPNKRVIAMLLAAIVFGIAWRIDTVAGIGLMVLALPYPRGTVFGNSNFALILLLLLIWLLRFTQGAGAARPRRTDLDMPIIALVGAYIISFYNISDLQSLGHAFQFTLIFIACVLMFYLIVNNIRTERDLKRLHVFQAVSLATILLMAVYELNNPGGAFIPGWIEFTQTVGTDFNTRNVRVGGPFFNYELLSEFCAISLLLVGFMIIRSTSIASRTLLVALGGLCAFILFATVTRGSFVALAVGIIYVLWTMRRRLNVVTLTIFIAAIISGFLVMNFYVANFTRSGDVAARFSQTEMQGVIPDTRVEAWQDGWDRYMEHPIIGRGPYYSPMTGVRVFLWPHSLYLFVAATLGTVGLAVFLWMLWRLFRLSRPYVDDLRHTSYSNAFLIVVRAQFLVFLVDQTKIEYLRDKNYPFQIWLLFASIVATQHIAARVRSQSKQSE